MSDMDEVLNEVEGLERKIERMEKTYVEVTNDLINAVKMQTAAIERMGEVMALAKSPSQQDLEDFAALREAFDKYNFKRKLILGGE